MVEGESIKQKTEDKDVHSGNQELVFERDPSFSGWYDEDEITHLDHKSEAVDKSTEDFDFKSPLIRQGGLENGILEKEKLKHNIKSEEKKVVHVKGSNNMDTVSTLAANNVSEKYVPFDVENPSGNEREQNFSNGGSILKNKHDPSRISSSDVLKTMFLILVWYTFSTFLTLYNKTLLGDHLGKFPAPLLMNTVHFSMQAILSKGITWYWSHRFQPSVTMSWRDYTLRVLPTALGTALDINLSNASLVFISVTFATMCKSAAPIFLLIFAFAFKLESPSVKLLGIILIISVGILLTVAKETEFEFWGFVFVMLAAVMSGFRWTMTQILLQVLQFLFSFFISTKHLYC
jgi:solute carrier family 35 protein C2